jgi:eukaryotic-like serine/threonine-protein kinase
VDPDRYARLKALVAEAAGLPRGERAAFLDRACGADPQLRHEAESLLAHDRTLPEVLSPDAMEDRLSHALASAMEPDTTPPQIGPYTIHEILGEGGMGIVYAATQEAPLRREVAIKLVTSDPRSARVLERFEVERRTVARLDHPAIARVFDAGTAPDGRPYFVMERVRGDPITTFADEQRLTTRERLDLFLAVCAGVQHAHQRGVIHRDLKPSNVLVTREADGPRPHIIDFGIARATLEPSEERLTLTGHLLGTPDYMSPEQAGVVDVDVDTRTDVYALGVILYQLLCGTRPYSFAKPTAGEIHRVLGGPPPRRPSTVVKEATVDAATARRSTPERLRRRLQGDLDNVALKALAREPDRRYASVEQLARDIRRHLAGLPVEARAATWSYRAGKFVGRHQAAVAGVTAVLLLLVAFALVTARQARVLQQERDRARREAETARQVSKFLVELFEDADPAQSKGDAITAREILDRGAARISKELGKQPEVQARLLSTMGDVYLALGLYDPAGSLLEQALARQQALPAADPAELAATLDRLGGLKHDLRDMAGSEEYSRRALELRRRTFGDESEEVADSLVNVAIAMRGNGRTAEADVLYRESIALYRRLFGSEDARVGWALYNYAWSLHQQGRVDEAEPFYVEAASLQRRLLGEHPELRDTLNSMAGVYFHRAQYQKAGEVWEEALAISRRLSGDSHTATARAYHNLARVPLALGDFARAESLARRAVEINLATIGPDHPNTATTQQSQGLALWRLGRLAEAERSLRSALGNRERTAGPDSQLTGATVAALAHVVREAGREEEALSLARRAAAIGEAQAARWPTAAAGMIESLAVLQAARGEPAEALSLWRRALALRESTQDSGPVERALARAGMGAAALDAGDPQGRQELSVAAAVLDSLLPAGHPDRVRVRALLDRTTTSGT